MASKKAAQFPVPDGFREAVAKCGSQIELAKQCGLSQQLVSHVSRGQGRLTGDAAIKISNATGIRLEALVPDLFEAQNGQRKVGGRTPPKPHA